ncbi:MAG: ABC transporter ATP-binding protein [Lachnospiraceae bacterium]|nr:ABC transporter ATP-binding protein [Lachnospiraceae bacterium]
MKKRDLYIVLAVFVKLLGTVSELILPSILEHIIDEIVPAGNLVNVCIWGSYMFVTAIVCRQLNVIANRRAIDNAHKISYEIRQDLFDKTINLSGSRFDALGLPSLISRMTSDSYNVQSFVQQIQTLCVRAPMMLIGGVAVAAFMDFQLTLILIIMLPILIAIIYFIYAKGIPLYTTVQRKLDTIVRIMRENITGIRVVKALSKEDAEKTRYAKANEDMTNSDITAAAVMAVPGPLMQMCLNIGLSLVVLYGAYRVNLGAVKPGVILAFLTYFNMITMGIMGLSRIFVTMSKASASADRIALVMDQDSYKTAEAVKNEAFLNEACRNTSDPAGSDHIIFDHVSFSYGTGSGNKEDFNGAEREKALNDISFALKRGESLGIIGPTGSGKTTIINLLMRFYVPDEGSITVDGQNVLSYDKDTLRRKFGTVFQNDMIFMDTLHGNIDFGRNLDEESIESAVRDAMAKEFIDSLPDRLDYEASIKGANLSGGQKQRIFVARAMAAAPEILILDDSSSALDYKTDASMRNAIRKNHSDSTLIMVAQRVSSIMNLDHILVLDNGRCIGYGRHKKLLAECETYRKIYEVQMGAMEG